MDYLKELETIQTWIMKTAGVPSYRLSIAKPKLARPVILWETPSRVKASNLDMYVYTQKVRQYGKLFMNNLDETLDVQEKLAKSVEELNNTLHIIDGVNVIGALKNVRIEFNDSESLDVPFSVVYEVTYSKLRPQEAPSAATVGTRIQAN